jgi:hypothetical protein
VGEEEEEEEDYSTNLVSVAAGKRRRRRSRRRRRRRIFYNRLSISRCYEKRTTRHRAAPARTRKIREMGGLLNNGT